MGKTATDAAADAFVAGLMVGFDRIADEKLTEKVDVLEQRIVERLPKVVALPPKPAENMCERFGKGTSMSCPVCSAVIRFHRHSYVVLHRDERYINQSLMCFYGFAETKKLLSR